MLVTCFSTARIVTTSRSAIAWLEVALGHRGQHLTLPRGDVLEHVASGASPAAGETTAGSRRPTGPDAANRCGELVEVGDAILQQISQTGGVLGEQSGGQTQFDVLGEHQHADVGVAGSDLLSCLEPSSLWVGGIRMSTIATSGLFCSTCASASSPVDARPTTWNPASTSKRLMPSRRRSESSATIKRTGSPP